ncbi:nicotinamide riboside transporter PnuC [Flavobacterium silvaticum]|uniref:Nicotinamide riboside transporter PnuC n=1 Tax=Flavobacterium silvaticum TaxID=1852020 RepID=A0A972JEM3_9FLAO|nr:nicotinamide riboside transporter PnuC [Flavobacterium silvaticum]NMH27044.1 nicotinamide mononucleotide transporter [Flavobacterium silvaticum]
MYSLFFESYRNTPTLDIVIEAIVFLFGIVSVWFAKKQNIWVFPTGLVATILTVYLLYKAGYLAEMALNVYYSVMSIYGWIVWLRPSANGQLPVTRTNRNQKLTGFGLFILTILVTFAIYALFGAEVKPANYIDIFISGIFFTAMWFMALKKIENWTLYIIADAIAVPLYLHRGLGMLSLQYVIFTMLAIIAYVEWRKILHTQKQ